VKDKTLRAAVEEMHQAIEDMASEQRQLNAAHKADMAALKRKLTDTEQRCAAAEHRAHQAVAGLNVVTLALARENPDDDPPDMGVPATVPVG
jgi:hypothetical protein